MDKAAAQGVNYPPTTLDIFHAKETGRFLLRLNHSAILIQTTIHFNRRHIRQGYRLL